MNGSRRSLPVVALLASLAGCGDRADSCALGELRLAAVGPAPDFLPASVPVPRATS